MGIRKITEWSIKECSAEKAAALATGLDISPLAARLLTVRGLDTPQKASSFLNISASMLHDPFLMCDMKKACEVICGHVAKKSKILVYGDYDVDGVTSTVILLQYLRSLGADVTAHIPERISEGYGLNKESIAKFAENGIGLIITVDSGITAIEEAEFASSLGVELVITDHHTCRDTLPIASAVVNPKRHDSVYPFSSLAGVGVVFKLLCALDSYYFSIDVNIASEKMLSLFSDMVSIGTIADVMPITDENRIIVSYGLKRIDETKNIGLEALLEEINGESKKNTGKSTPKKKVTSSQVGFIIAPRINACGRIGNAMRAVELFTTDNKNTARMIAAELCAINKQRQIFENNILTQALEYVENNHDFSKDLFIVAENEEWHHGVIGIAASRICEKYHLPCILISFAGGKDENDPGEDIGKGSGRSIEGLNIVEALASASDKLVKYGGHDLAAGLTVKRKDLPMLKKLLNEYAAEKLSTLDLREILSIDTIITKNDINLRSASEIGMLEPFGLGNSVPLFCCQDMTISEIISIGDGKHTRMVLEKDNISVTALYFGVSSAALPFFPGDTADIVCNMDINSFQNNKTVQLIIRDIRHSRQYRDMIVRKTSQYKVIRTGMKLPGGFELIPSRDDFKLVYLYLRKKIQSKHTLISENVEFIPDERYISVDMPYLSSKIIAETKNRIGILKLLIIMDIFVETGIIVREESEGFPMLQKIALGNISAQNKINLEHSEFLQELKRLYFENT